MKSWTALNVNEFILFDMAGSLWRRIEMLGKKKRKMLTKPGACLTYCHQLTYCLPGLFNWTPPPSPPPLLNPPSSSPTPILFKHNATRGTNRVNLIHFRSEDHCFPQIAPSWLTGRRINEFKYQESISLLNNRLQSINKSTISDS